MSTTTPEDLLAAGKAALARTDWPAARDSLTRAADALPTGEVFELLGRACWWQDDGKAAMEAREASYRLYREEGDLYATARLATLIGVDYWDFRGDSAVANGWLQRAETLLADLETSDDHGWMHVYRGYASLMFANDIAEARRRLELVAGLSPRLRNVDIDTMAVALRGLVLIREGLVTEGMRYIDEAMTGAVGGDMSDLAAIGNTCCSMIYACEAVADYDRAAQWCERAREFSRRLGMEAFFAICRNYYATVLIWRGNWSEADVELSAALRELQTNRPTYALESLAKLGELRRRQGRIAEAEEIFLQAEPHRTAVHGRAALALDRGDVQTATDLLQRLLRRLSEEDMAARVFVLELLVRVRLQADDLPGAEAILPEINALVAQIATTPMAAVAAAAKGTVNRHRGDLEEARKCFEDAIDLYIGSEATFDAACVRLDCAEVLEAQGRVDAAMHQAMLAHTAFTQLGAGLYRDRSSQVVARLSSAMGAPPAASKLPHGLTAREAEVLWLIAAGKTNQDIARELVLSVRTVERHISTVYEKLGLHGRAARASAASIAVGLHANT